MGEFSKHLVFDLKASLSLTFLLIALHTFLAISGIIYVLDVEFLCKK